MVESADDFLSARQLRDVRWGEPPEGCKDAYEFASGSVAMRFGEIASGRGRGVRVIEINTGPMQVYLLPSRGMGIWQICCEGIPFQWFSPVDGPVHPSLVPVMDPGGLGWLEGFDELMVRCGMASNGAPDFDENGTLRYPLHGRVANLPAERLWCEKDGESCVVAGEVYESKLFFNRLRLVSKLRLMPNGRSVEVEDVITNLSAQPAESQMLYHINLGSPVLGEGAKLTAPIEELAPRNEHAAADVATWDHYPGPILGYQEQVHFMRLRSDNRGETAVMLESADHGKGIGVAYDTHSLPYFVVWKNTAALDDGYVTGLEPSTNFPNPRTFEGEHERVTRLDPGQSVTHRLRIDALVTEKQVQEYRKLVETLAGDKAPKIHERPKNEWSV